MSEETTTDTNSAYQRWLRGAHTPAHARRTAARNAAFFLPHLRPGTRLLDCGCGPGSITIGLAEAIGPEGVAFGIDINPDAIDAARALAAQRACTNVQFDLASVDALPHDDASFDAVFSHFVMQHLPDPLAALREMRRVLRPGGIIGVADADQDGTIIWPADHLLDDSFPLMRELRRAGGGGNPRIGKQLRALLHDAGFARVEAMVTADCDGTEETAQRSGAWWANYLRSPELRAHAIAVGLASDSDLEAMSSAWERWSAAPGAFWARFSCQAIGYAE